VEAICFYGDGAPPQERTQDHPPGHLVLPRCHLAQRIQGTCPESHKRGELWKAIEEGSWEEVEALLLKALSQRKNPRDQRGLGNLSIYLSRKLERESRMPETPRLQSVPKPMEASPLSLLSHHPMGFGRKGVDRGYLPSFAVQRVLSAARLPENPKRKISSLHPFP
jgi:hypothetical protein